MKITGNFFESLKRINFSRMFRRKNDVCSEKKYGAMVGKNSWSFISFSTPNEEMERYANFYERLSKRMNYIIYNSKYPFNFDDVTDKEFILYKHHIRTNKDFKQVFTKDFEKCRKERGEAFACFVMITLMEHIKQPCPTEAKYIKEYLLECPTGEEILKKWDETSNISTHIQKMPDALANERAQKLFKKLQDADYLDENFQPAYKMRKKNGTFNLTILAILAKIVGNELRLSPLYTPFEELWHVSNLMDKASAHFNDDKHKALKNDIYRILK